MNAICDSCGFKFKMSMLKPRWDGMLVCSEDWNPRPESDFRRIPRTEKAPQTTNPEPDVVYQDVTFTDTVEDLPTGTFNNEL